MQYNIFNTKITNTIRVRPGSRRNRDPGRDLAFLSRSRDFNRDFHAEKKEILSHKLLKFIDFLNIDLLNYIFSNQEFLILKLYSLYSYIIILQLYYLIGLNYNLIGYYNACKILILTHISNYLYN